MTEKASFGAGCFWGVEAKFQEIDGVLQAISGYQGGHLANPTYKDVCSDRTGHAEVVEVEYDPARVSYEKLLDVFWNAHDPTQVNRQGPDMGRQYRSAILPIRRSRSRLRVSRRHGWRLRGKFRRPIATVIEPAKPFYRAEEYHQQYLAKRALRHCHI